MAISAPRHNDNRVKRIKLLLWLRWAGFILAGALVSGTYILSPAVYGVISREAQVIGKLAGFAVLVLTFWIQVKNMPPDENERDEAGQ